MEGLGAHSDPFNANVQGMVDVGALDWGLPSPLRLG